MYDTAFKERLLKYDVKWLVAPVSGYHILEEGWVDVVVKLDEKVEGGGAW